MEIGLKRLLGGIGLLTSGALLASIGFLTYNYPESIEKAILITGVIFGIPILIVWIAYATKLFIRSHNDALRQVLGGILFASWVAFIVVMCIYPDVRSGASMVAGTICGSAALIAWPTFSFLGVLSKE